MAAPKKYPDELRERAVRVVRESGRPIAHVAEDLGIHREALRLWVRQDEADRGEREDRLTSDEREELKRMRAENSELKRANEILKAGAAASVGSVADSYDNALAESVNATFKEELIHHKGLEDAY